MTTRESLKVIGEDILKHCPPSVRRPTAWPGSSEVYCLDTEAFTTQYLHLQRKIMRLSTDGSIIGAAVFGREQWVPVYTMDGEMFISKPLANAIYVDHYACTLQPMPVPAGRFRFTEMHEDCHHILVRMGFARATEPVMYRRTDREESREERMADYLAAYLLMPDSVLLAMMQHRDHAPIVSYEGILPARDDLLFDRMAQTLQVSGSALMRRLRDAGLWEDRSIYEYRDPDRHPSYDPIGGLMP